MKRKRKNEFGDNMSYNSMIFLLMLIISLELFLIYMKPLDRGYSRIILDITFVMRFNNGSAFLFQNDVYGIHNEDIGLDIEVRNPTESNQTTGTLRMYSNNGQDRFHSKTILEENKVYNVVAYWNQTGMFLFVDGQFDNSLLLPNRKYAVNNRWYFGHKANETRSFSGDIKRITLILDE